MQSSFGTIRDCPLILFHVAAIYWRPVLPTDIMEK